jgi:hypothetical protein
MRSAIMSVPGSYEYGPDWEPGDMFGADEPIHPFEEPSGTAVGSQDDDLPPDPAIDEHDVAGEPPS